jgi:hypothetical protein
LLPTDSVAVQSTLFDKSPEKNWLVSLHQGEGGCLFDEIGNLVEPTERPATEGRTGLTSHGRRDAARTAADCSGWSEEEGQLYVQPPVSVLEQLVAVRIHIDDCPEESGGLRVVPRSHSQGRLSRERGGRASENCECQRCTLRSWRDEQTHGKTRRQYHSRYPCVRIR